MESLRKFLKNTKQIDIFQENHQEQRELNLNKKENEFQTCCEVKKTNDPQGFEIIKDKNKSTLIRIKTQVTLLVRTYTSTAAAWHKLFVSVYTKFNREFFWLLLKTACHCSNNFPALPVHFWPRFFEWMSVAHFL